MNKFSNYIMHKKNITNPIQTFLPLVSILFLSYFLYHTLEGDRGISALYKVKNELNLVENQLANLTEQRERLEKRNALLSSYSLDTDMLDEQAKRLLLMLKPNEFLVIP